MDRSVLSDQRGVVTVEFALLLPIIIAFIFMIIDFGKVMNYRNDANQIAANGARLAAVDSAPGGDLIGYLENQADTDELRDGDADSVPNPIDICIEFPNGTSNVGDPVKVNVESSFTIAKAITQLVGSDVTLPVRGSATMRIERAPSNYTASC